MATFLETFRSDREEWSIYRSYIVLAARSSLLRPGELCDRIAPEFPRNHFEAEGILSGPTTTFFA